MIPRLQVSNPACFFYVPPSRSISQVSLPQNKMSHAPPVLPRKQVDFIDYLNHNRHKSISDILKPYQDYEGSLRELFAQQPNHHVLQDNHVNLLSLFDSKQLSVRARRIQDESAEEQSKYIMPLRPEERKAEGTPATVQSLAQFKDNFNVFSEGSLVDLDWSNVILAGSAVTTCLLPLPAEHAASKRATRKYYHEIVAPASDIDLFLYGLDEKATEKKIKEIESTVRNTVLADTITVRTKNAITIASQHPTRHVQIVLRCYKSVSEILTVSELPRRMTACLLCIGF